MSISLNGTSQYVSLGNGTSLAVTLPFSVAVLVDSADLGAPGVGLISQGDYITDGWGIFAYGASPKKLGIYASFAGGAAEIDGSNNALTANNGWYLVVLAIYKATNPFYNFRAYSFKDATWSSNESGIFSGTASANPAPGGTTTTVIGGNYLSGAVTNFYPGKIGWAGIWDGDFANGASANIPLDARVNELITRGPWGLIDSSCRGLWVFSDDAIDRSTAAHNGSLIASPSYAGSGPTELSPWMVIPVTRQPAGGGAITYNLQADMQGRGGEQLTPNLNKSFTSNLDAYGKDKLTPGKTYSFLGNLDGKAGEVLTLGKTLGIASNMQGQGEASAAPGRQNSLTGSMQGQGGESFIPARAAQLLANLEAASKLSGIAQRSVIARAVMVGRGWLKAFFGEPLVIKPRPQATIVEVSGPTSTLAEVTALLQSSIVMVITPQGSLAEVAGPVTVLSELTATPQTTIMEVIA